MLVPAILYKSEIEQEFTKALYTEDFFYYSGYCYCNSITEIRTEDYLYQYAIIDSGKKLIGYLAYRIDVNSNSVNNFGLYSFDRGNYIVGKDLFEKMEELISKYHRVEWRMIGGNPVQKHYDRFCKKYGGNCVVLHDVTKDDFGNYHDEYIYEIVNGMEKRYE